MEVERRSLDVTISENYGEKLIRLTKMNAQIKKTKGNEKWIQKVKWDSQILKLSPN